ncbi:HAD family hydrolase [Photorhabdus hindustanensis]|uniref:HAD family hydrolase n=1 Tax=Photorhabdus hindustanensis TaxID=2918802 RepID=UPI001C614E45|nr:HAD family hydrolase [Photorhabdus hindustanensis]
MLKSLLEKKKADEVLSYMLFMLNKANDANIPIKKQDLLNFGSNIDFFPGVLDWFSRINQYGNSKGVEVRHFIISSGLQEMIQGTKIAKEFEKIYASRFMYDHNGIAYWPALAVNYTTKTQYLFRINKNCLDECDNTVINKFIDHTERPIPFDNMVFIGDGETDIPCMRLVKAQGGHSIAVYPKKNTHSHEKAKQFAREGRISLAALADYTPDSAIERSVKAMIDKVIAQRIIQEAGN